MKIPELLVPANNLEVLKVAVLYGADAVYIGGEAFGLRAGAKNATLDELREGVAFAHARRVKVYITANILAHNADLEGIRQYFHDLKEVKPDALIMHPGPINRGVELTGDVADGKQSVILEQVTNGLAIRMAVLYLVAGCVKK